LRVTYVVFNNEPAALCWWVKIITIYAFLSNI